MKENDSGLKHRELTNKIIGIFYEVYNELCHGFLESVYETAFEIARKLRAGHTGLLESLLSVDREESSAD